MAKVPYEAKIAATQAGEQVSGAKEERVPFSQILEDEGYDYHAARTQYMERYGVDPSSSSPMRQSALR